MRSLVIINFLLYVSLTVRAFHRNSWEINLFFSLFALFWKIIDSEHENNLRRKIFQFYLALQNLHGNNKKALINFITFVLRLSRVELKFISLTSITVWEKSFLKSKALLFSIFFSSTVYFEHGKKLTWKFNCFSLFTMLWSGWKVWNIVKYVFVFFLLFWNIFLGTFKL